MQVALYREAIHLALEGVASIEDIDAAIAYGPGLRWAILGPHMLHHLAGGEGGLRHLLGHIGPGIETWWNDLGRPDLTPEVVDRLVGMFEAGEQRPIGQIAAERDVLLLGLLESLAETRRALAAGKVGRVLGRRRAGRDRRCRPLGQADQRILRLAQLQHLVGRQPEVDAAQDTAQSAVAHHDQARLVADAREPVADPLGQHPVALAARRADVPAVLDMGLPESRIAPFDLLDRQAIPVAPAHLAQARVALLLVDVGPGLLGDDLRGLARAARAG